MTSKKQLSERDICTKYINPAIQKAGWDMLMQVREEVSFTDGRIYVKGNLTSRGRQKRVDYILYYKPNIPIAIIEAKNNKHSINAGIQQALAYDEILDIPTVYSSNGDGFYEHDRSTTDGKIEKQLSLDEFPSPFELWQRYKKYKGIKLQSKNASAHKIIFLMAQTGHHAIIKLVLSIAVSKRFPKVKTVYC